MAGVGADWPETFVGPLRLLDGGPEDVVKGFEALACEMPAVPEHRVIPAAHVAALLHLDDMEYVRAFNASRLRYADGNAIVLLARAGGAKRIRRAVTTDVAWDFIGGMHRCRGRLPRVAFVGGEPGLAASALASLEAQGVAVPACSEHGYHHDWAEAMTRLRAAEPDLLFVGLGSPLETVWAQEHAVDLPGALLVTCGGWFGYLVGDERRAPRLVRAAGLEFAYRLVQDPTRLAERYAKGAMKTLSLVPSQFGRRP